VRVEDLSLSELVQFSDGEVTIGGRRLVLHSMDAFAQFRHDLIESVGVDSARTILTRFGYFWGEADAAAMKRMFVWDTLEEWLRAGPRLHTLQGVARSHVVALSIEEPGRFYCEMNWYNSGEAVEHRLQFGPETHAVCWMLVGYASGYASHCIGRKVFFLEQKCAAKGDPFCSAVGKDSDSWGSELDTMRRYFESEDIAHTVKELSEALRLQSEELEEHRRKLSLIQLGRDRGFAEIRSPAFQRVLEMADRVAPYDTTVLLTGETGVGKEVLADHIHRLSRRSKVQMVTVNCGALPETLLDSELFGHRAGSFTGASEDHVGLFERADNGTIFLDEIGDISQALQVKLLRVLQSRELMRVGESRPRKVNVRVIAATNRNLEEAISAGTFRSDLFYRLGVVQIVVPPLRERASDILPLSRVLLRRIESRLDLQQLTMEPSCLDFLTSYPWPGNVRELENVLERAAVMCEKNRIRPEDLPAHVTSWSDAPDHALSASRSLAEVEQHHILRVLESAGGKKVLAARILGISTATLWRKLKNVHAQ